MAKATTGKGKRRCVKGEECGNSCITKGKTCHDKPPAALQEKVEVVATKIKETKSKTIKTDGTQKVSKGIAEVIEKAPKETTEVKKRASRYRGEEGKAKVQAKQEAKAAAALEKNKEIKKRKAEQAKAKAEMRKESDRAWNNFRK